MGKVFFWIYQFTAWTAVVVLALVNLFWEPGMKSPSPPPSPESITPLVEGLRLFLAEVPSASITDRKPR